MSGRTKTADPKEAELPFEEAAQLLKALGHPLRLRLVCGLCREPSNLTRIVNALETPLSTVALHLAVLRRMGILREERRGAEVQFSLGDDRVHQILEVFCRETGGPTPESWGWGELGRRMKKLGGAKSR
jgi:ArsR family transcriptional regulator, arsenate/arsenite/antimonite-responsive transcriptional repressor